MTDRSNNQSIEEREESWRLATRLVRGGTRRSELGEVSESIFMSAGFRYDEAEEAAARFKGESDGYTYSRLGNPTVAMLERRLALLEGAEACRAVASGMAAVTAAILCVTTVLVDGPDLEGWEKALAPGARCVFLESPANPTLELVDIKAVAELAHKAGARLIVDNVFATPLAQRPLELGADVVVYSGTKYIDGQGRCLAGAVLGDKSYINDVLLPFLRHTGPALSPFNAWVLLKGLETFKLRVEAHCRAAAKVADWLGADKRIAKVLYPHRADHPQAALAQRQMRLGGGVVAFEVPGGSAGAFRFMNALRVIDISNNLGDTKSLITHPTTTTHQRIPAAERQALGISDGLLRLSVGLEDIEDLIEDIDQALRA
jgi:O-succinylhomoserine sulfhydrylase